jgi:dsRNA-specific ribonuclease
LCIAVQGVEVNPTMAAIGKDPKTELQEWLQGRKMKLPLYRVVGTLGAAHQQSFDVECEVVEFSLCERGIGGSRRAAEQAAATAMLQNPEENGITMTDFPDSAPRPECRRAGFPSALRH